MPPWRPECSGGCLGTEHVRFTLRLVVAGGMPDRSSEPPTPVTLEGRGGGRPDPWWGRDSRARQCPGAVSLRAAGPPSLVVSAAALVLCGVSARSIGFVSPSVHSCDEGRGPSLDASPSASSSSPPKNCPLCRSRMGPLGGRVDFGRRCAGFRWARGAASGPKSRRASPLRAGRVSAPRGVTARSGEVKDGGAEGLFLRPGRGSRARASLTMSRLP
jgi:hypothetical protein